MVLSGNSRVDRANKVARHSQGRELIVEFTPGKSEFHPKTGKIKIDHRASADSRFGILAADQSGNADCIPSPFRRRLAHEFGHAAGHHDPHGVYENHPRNDNVAVENAVAEAWGLPMRIDYGLPCNH